MQTQTMIGLADDYDEDAIIDLMAGSLLFSSLDEKEKESLPAELRTRVKAAGC